MIIPLLLLTLDVSYVILQDPVVLIPENATAASYTCEEFLEGSSFNASSILDRDWWVFYTWSREYEEPYQVRFRLPTLELIERFKVEAATLPLSPGNWSAIAFLMESTLDLSALFFHTATPGMFHVITSLVFKYNVTEELIFAMKVVDPGYLAFMNCKIQVVVALAPPEIFPKEKDVEEAAKVLQIKTLHGFPYSVRDPVLEYKPALAGADDDADDEEDTEVEMANAKQD